MERIVVSSTNIVSIGYDPNSQTLEVEFTSYSIYQYFGVPEHIHAELMNAGSKGQYLNNYIKNVYQYSKIC
jgi:hypothetical protein